MNYNYHISSQLLWCLFCKKKKILFFIMVQKMKWDRAKSNNFSNNCYPKVVYYGTENEVEKVCLLSPAFLTVRNAVSSLYKTAVTVTAFKNSNLNPTRKMDWT